MQKLASINGPEICNSRDRTPHGIIKMMRGTEGTENQPYVLLRHRDAAPCIVEKEELLAQKRMADRAFIRRGITFIVLFICLILTEPKVVRFAEEHSYFNRAAEFDVRPFAFALVGLLLGIIFWAVIRIERVKRGDSNSPCPKCGKPLIGANVWPPTILPACALARRREQRMQNLLVRASSKYVIGPAFLVMLLSFPLALLIVQNLRPELDPNGWPFFLRTFPVIILIYLVAGYLLTLWYVRRAIRRKGWERALKFLFPEAFQGRIRWRDKVWYRALGISALIRQKQ